MIDGLSHWSATWSQYFGVAVVQNTVFLAIVFALLHVLRNTSAQTRYVVAAAGLFKLLLPPFVPLARLSAPIELSSSLASAVVTLAGGGQLSPLPRPDSFALPDALSWLFLVWLIAAVAYVTLSLVNTLRLARLLRHATPLAQRGALSLPCPASVRLLESDRIKMPLTLGIFPSKIYLPPSWRTWSPSFRDSVVRHEFAHIARLDGLLELAQTLCGALYFFHPLVWVLNRRLRAYREMACDDSSVGDERASRLDYSRELAGLAESATLYPLAHGSVSALLRRRNEILARVRYQTEEGVMRSVPKRKLAVVLAVLVCCLVSLSWHLEVPAALESEGKAKGSSTEKPPVKICLGDTEAIRIEIRDGEKFRIDETKTAVETLKKYLKSASDEDLKRIRIHVCCAEKLQMRELFDIQNVLRKSGFTKVSYENGEAVGAPLAPLPKVLEEKAESLKAGNAADICVCAPGHFTFGGRKVRVAEISQLLKPRLEKDPTLAVWITARPEATFSDFLAALKEVKSAGAQRIFFRQPATEEAR